jgi:L-cysteine:1D-myo-inositol 2-amino-2-deoxy-alpha-D-glucopyranoside ligase
MAALDTRAPIAEPRPTQSMPDIIDMIRVLRERGFTYENDGTTYFDVTKAPTFGQLSHYSRGHMIDLARERGGHPDDPRQHDPLDFVLWQPSLADEPTWDSPFGPGRPGWHIECSAMSKAVLGTTLDLHGGGADLIYPHHECEIAQSEAANDAPFVRHWMHTGLVAYQGTKMSKSLGNLVFVSELRKTADPRAIRLALMGHHYRDNWEWFDDEIDDATERLERLHAAANSTGAGPDPRPYLTRVHEALDDDLDAPAARDALDELARGILAGAGVHDQSTGALRDAAAQCGIDLDKPLP